MAQLIKLYKRYEVLIIIFVFITVSSGALVFAQSGTSPYVVYSENRWFGTDFAYFPCEYGESLHNNGAWSSSIEPDNDNRWDYLIIDHANDTTIQVFTHGEIDYALIWETFALGDDQNPHPSGAYVVNCYFDAGV